MLPKMQWELHNEEEGTMEGEEGPAIDGSPWCCYSGLEQRKASMQSKLQNIKQDKVDVEGAAVQKCLQASRRPQLLTRFGGKSLNPFICPHTHQSAAVPHMYTLAVRSTVHIVALGLGDSSRCLSAFFRQFRSIWRSQDANAILKSLLLFRSASPLWPI